jgi:hypothetical protein
MRARHLTHACAPRWRAPPPRDTSREPFDDPAMREFRPPVRPSVVRIVLAVVIAAAALVPTGLLLRVVTGMSQVSYAIAGGALTVRSGDPTWGDRTVRLAEVTDVRVTDLRGGRRTSGTALPGYCAGHFSYEGLGGVWQATNCAGRALVVRSRDVGTPVLVLTPPDLEGFQAALAAGTDTIVTLPPPDKGPLTLIAWISAPIALIVTFMIGSLMLFGPNRVRYLVGGGALVVRTMFGKKRIELAGARARAHVPARLWRIAGTAMPGYFTGLFREEGKNTRVYATDVKQMVLIEGGASEVRVLVSPEHLHFFLAALRDEGASVTEPGGPIGH